MAQAQQTIEPIAENVPLSLEKTPRPDILSLVSPDRPIRLGDAVITRDTRLGRQIRRFIEHFDQQAFASGLRLELSTDFEMLAAINPHLDKLPLTPQFDPAVSEIGPVNGFWLKGVDARGEIVHTQAVRFDDLSHTTLALHLKSLRAFYAEPAVSAHPDESCDVSAPAACAITGRICYHGEVWIKKESGLRGHDLAHSTPRLALAIALARWLPDFVYGTVQPGIAEKGVVTRYGYRNMEPGGIHWIIPRTGERLDEWLVWMAWRDLIEMIERAGV
ncbi:MAG: hypothetical protein RIC16_15590 [Rhodospirillales bacterium]